MIVRPLAGSPTASPVSSGGRSAAPSTAPPPAGRPRVIRSAASVQALSSATSCARDPVVTSKAAKCSRSWAGVTMPAWCAPRNAYAALPADDPDPGPDDGWALACPATNAPASPAAVAPPPISPRRDTRRS